MIYRNGRTATAAGKKERRLSAPLALAVAFALAFPGSAALANEDPMPGVNVKLGNSGSVTVAKTDRDGAFNFTDLAPGQYDLTIGGLPPKSVIVGTGGTTGGKVMNSDGGVIVTGDFEGSPSRVMSGSDGSMSIFDRWGISVVAPGGGDGKARTVTVNPVNDPPSVWNNGDGSDMTAVRPDVRDVKPAVSAQDGTRSEQRDMWDVTWRSRTASPPKDAGTAGTPVIGIPVRLEGDPGSAKVSATTGENGAYGFDKLPAGKYKLSIDGQPSKPVTVGNAGTLDGKVVRGSDGNPVLLVIAGNLGIGTKSQTPGGAGSAGFGSSNPAMGPGYSSSPGSTFPITPIIPGMPSGPGAGSPGGAMGGAGMKP